MPSNPTTILYDRLWVIMEAWTPFTALVSAGNRIKLSGDGWLRERHHRLPGDFPQVDIRFKTFSHSAFTNARGLGAEQEDHCALEIVRVEDVAITIIANSVKNAGSHPLKEAAIDALLNGKSRLGIPELVAMWGPIRGEQRDTKPEEKEGAGTFIGINFPVSMFQNNYVPTV